MKKSEYESILIEPIRMAARIEPNFQKRIFATNDLTEALQLRAIYKSHGRNTDGEYTTEFVCGLDILTTPSGTPIVVSVEGIWGRNFYQWIKRYLSFVKFKMIGDLFPEDTIGFIVCDDSDSLDRECRSLTDGEKLRLCQDIHITTEDETLSDIVTKYKIQDFNF